MSLQRLRHARTRAEAHASPSVSSAEIFEIRRLAGAESVRTLHEYVFDSGLGSFFEGDPAIPIERGYTTKIRQAKKYAEAGYKALSLAADALGTVYRAKGPKSGWIHPEDEAGSIARSLQGAASVTRRGVEDIDALLQRLGG